MKILGLFGKDARHLAESEASGQEEIPLDAKILHQEVEEVLQSAESQWVAKVVKELPEEVPSMAWRSQLSATIMVEAAKTRKRRAKLNFMRAGAGLALAACLSVFVLLRVGHQSTTPLKVLSPAASQSFEAAMVQVHEESSTVRDVTGTGLSASDLRSESAAGSSSLDQEDVGDL